MVGGFCFAMELQTVSGCSVKPQDGRFYGYVSIPNNSNLLANPVFNCANLHELKTNILKNPRKITDKEKTDDQELRKNITEKMDRPISIHFPNLTIRDIDINPGAGRQITEYLVWHDLRLHHDIIEQQRTNPKRTDLESKRSDNPLWFITCDLDYVIHGGKRISLVQKSYNQRFIKLGKRELTETFLCFEEGSGDVQLHNTIAADKDTVSINGFFPTNITVVDGEICILFVSRLGTQYKLVFLDQFYNFSSDESIEFPKDIEQIATEIKAEDLKFFGGSLALTYSSELQEMCIYGKNTKKDKIFTYSFSPKYCENKKSKCNTPTKRPKALLEVLTRKGVSKKFEQDDRS